MKLKDKVNAAVLNATGFDVPELGGEWVDAGTWNGVS